MTWRKSASKMGNEKTNGFDSKGEHRRYQELLIHEKLGLVRNIRTQVKYELTPRIGKERASSYIADFVYDRLSGVGISHTADPAARWDEIVEDCKGYRTPLYILKRKIMRHRYGIEILETTPPKTAL